MRKQEFDVTVECELGDEYFLDWDELPDEIKKFWETTTLQSLCEGEGVMGVGCYGCPFCKEFNVV